MCGINCNCSSVVRLRIIISCLVLVIYCQNLNHIYSFHCSITQRTLKPYFPTKAAIAGANSLENALFTKKIICALFLSVVWSLSIHILLSNDVHPNPGPDSASISTTTTSQNTSLFEHNLSIIHLNIQSLVPKLDILEVEMQQYDLPVFTETWLHSEISTDDILISNFDPPYRKYRDNRLGGVVAFYVRTGLHCIQRSDLVNGEIEALCLELSFKSHKFLLSGIYRPPNSGNMYWDLIENTLDNMTNSRIGDLIVVGDFNCDMQTLASSNKMQKFMSSYNLHQLIDEPTHFTEHSSSVIDLILVSKPENVIYSGVSSPFIPNILFDTTVRLLHI